MTFDTGQIYNNNLIFTAFSLHILKLINENISSQIDLGGNFLYIFNEPIYKLPTWQLFLQVVGGNLLSDRVVSETHTIDQLY